MYTPEGVSLRDYFAAHALANTAFVNTESDVSKVADYAYAIADAMMYHRKHNEPEV